LAVGPLEAELVESAFFNDPHRFPPGTLEFDDAPILRNLPHEWHALPGLPSGSHEEAALPS